MFYLRIDSQTTENVMRPDIARLWHELESNRTALMQELSAYDNDRLNRKPSPEAWSVTQVMLHLIEAELMATQYIEKKLSFGVNIPRAGFKSAVRRKLLSLAFALPIKIKAPEKLNGFPDYSDFNELKTRWASQRLALQELINKMPDNVLDGEIFKHIVAGKMNIAQMISFFNEHFNRHKKQIARTLQA
jgi:uncharacterized damage-inducible protein DinB